MAERREGGIENTLSPTRNFTITTHERIRAAYGPPAYAVRKRKIEDLDESIVSLLVTVLDRVGSDAAALADSIWRLRMEKRVLELNALIDAHNQYYPCEANLPIDVSTGELRDGGRPWKPLAKITLDAMLARARAARASHSG
jgi:hypothetical protein